MTTVTQMKCACEPCLCIVNLEDAVQKDGHYYCTEACANGHPKGSPSCGNSSCGCGS